VPLGINHATALMSTSILHSMTQVGATSPNRTPAPSSRGDSLARALNFDPPTACFHPCNGELLHARACFARAPAFGPRHFILYPSRACAPPHSALLQTDSLLGLPSAPAIPSAAWLPTVPALLELLPTRAGRLLAAPLLHQLATDHPQAVAGPLRAYHRAQVRLAKVASEGRSDEVYEQGGRRSEAEGRTGPGGGSREGKRASAGLGGAAGCVLALPSLFAQPSHGLAAV